MEPWRSRQRRVWAGFKIEPLFFQVMQAKEPGYSGEARPLQRLDLAGESVTSCLAFVGVFGSYWIITYVCGLPRSQNMVSWRVALRLCHG